MAVILSPGFLVDYMPAYDRIEFLELDLARY